MSNYTRMIRYLLFGLMSLAACGLLGQVNDDFADGDFTANPAWTGDVNLWQVNPLLELQSAGNPATETIYLATPSSRVLDTEWRIRLRYDNNPSGSNNLRVYLISDQADLTGPLNGYFVTAGGETGTDDSYDLYRQDGSSETLLIDGLDGSANPTDGVLQVICDPNGNWQMAVDQGGTGIVTPQGTATDNTHTSGSHMGVVVAHTSSRNEDYFVDDVYVGDVVVDLDPPQVLSAEALSDSEVEVEFDEVLDASSAETATHYSLDQGLGSPASAQLVSGDPRRVRLSLGTPLTNQTDYQLTVSNVADLSGNAISAPQTVAFRYFVPEIGAFRDVIFNEFMPDETPTQGLPEEEFVELYNRSQKIIDLDGWTIQDGSSSVGTLPSYLLQPGEYLILVSNTNLALFAPFGNVLAPSTLPTLNNGGDDLILRNADSLLIDSLRYTDDWYRDEAKADGGFSLELINPDNEACPPPANWRASDAVQGGTPGTQNSVFNLTPENEPPTLAEAVVLNSSTLRVCFSEIMDPATLAQPAHFQLGDGLGAPQSAVPDSTGQCVTLTVGGAITPGAVYTLTVSNVTDCSGNPIVPGSSLSVALGRTVLPFEVVINEFMADPTPAVGLPAVDFVELYNRTDDVLDISGFRISDASGSAEWGDAVLFPGEYLIVCDEDDVAAFAPFERTLGLEGFPNFNNAGDSLLLRSEFDEVIDYVFYTDDWYRDESRSEGGFTLERIDPDFVDCNLAGNWRASQADIGGTPGAVNSVDGTFVDNEAPRLDQAFALNAQTVLLLFSEPMDPSTLETEANYRFDQGLGPPRRARVISLDNRTVSLELDSPLQPRVVYTLQVGGLSDCVGNGLADSLRLGLTEPPQPFEVVFNEIYPDQTPLLGLPDAEFIELYNRTDKLLNLSGLTLSDGGTPVEITAGTLFPGEALILCDAADVAAYQPFGRTLAVSIPALGNSGDSLRLRNANGETLDYLFYEASWFGSIEAAEGGITLERVDPDFVDCNQPGNWQASTHPSGGTPGQANSVQGTFVDETAPRILAVRPTANGIALTFDEQMDPATLENPAFYEADRGLGQPILALAQAPHYRRVELVFATPLDTNRVYQLAIDSLSDCVGNVLTVTQPFGLPVLAQPGDLLINEILFNPYTGGADFVEVVNASDNLLDLGTLLLGESLPGTDSLFNEDPISEESFVLLPGDLICLTRDELFQRLAYRPPLTARFLEMSGFPSYDDAEGECVIFRRDSTVIDRFFYLDDYHYPTLEDDDGVSLERISLRVPTQQPDNWHSTSSIVGYATPGYDNSQAQPSAEGGSEVTLEPQVFSPNLDGEDDVLAIHYQFDFVGANARVSVFDTRGHLVQRVQQNMLLSPTPGTFFWDGFDARGQKVGLGMYIVLFEVTNNDTGERLAFRRVAVVADRL